MMAAEVDYLTAIGAAVRAPSLHNSQPWRFQVEPGGVAVRLDPRRRLPASDPTGWGARLAAGAALFNLRLGIAVQGWQPEVRLLPDPTQPHLVARVSLGAARPPTPQEQRLWQAVWHRHSNRAPFWPDPVPAEVRADLVAAAAAEHAWLVLLIGPGPVNALAEIAHAANQVLMRDSAYRAELEAWIRDSRAATDGVPRDAGGPSPAAHDLLPRRPFSDRPRRPGDERDEQPLVAVLGTAEDGVGDQLVAGQALQRVLLTATDAKLAVSMISQPIEVPAAREQLRLALRQHGAPQMVLRIGYGPPGSPTPRRPLADVVD